MRARRSPVPAVVLALVIIARISAGTPPGIQIPESRSFPNWCDSPNGRVATLGAELFVDTRLSGDGSLSCGSCHLPELGFADGKPLAIGMGGKQLQRHTPGLVNLESHRSFFWDGRAASLESQAEAVITNPDELGSSMADVVKRLSQDPWYQQEFNELFAKKGLRESTVLTALAAFERKIVAKESRFDRFQQGDKSALTEKERRGFETFSGKALCSRCHKGTELSDQKFHNTGVETDDLGRIKVVRNPEFQLRPYPFFANHKAFKTPSLRNVSITAPYFHNGSEASLEDVVRFYNQGGKAVDTYGRSPDVGQIGLTESEIFELVAFLGSLRSEVQFCPPNRSVTNAIPANAEP